MDETLQYARQNREQHLAELFDFLRLPSISTDPDHAQATADAAAWLAGQMAAAGLENARVVPTERHPLVYADWLRAGPDAPTVLIYGHYDVQPADPLEKWDTPPFEPTVRQDYLYARGAADDKGQLYVHVKAAEAYLRTAGRLPLNVKFLIEGEEEIGSHSLHAFIPHNHDLLAADSALISDSSMLGPGQPAIVYGLRGNCHVLLDLLARLKSEYGHVLIPGFYDRVRPLSLEERETLAQVPLSEAEWLSQAGAPQLWGEPEYTLAERIGAAWREQLRAIRAAPRWRSPENTA